MIDTLRYAGRLKAAGVRPNHAEAMSRALNDELAGGVATKDDLGQAVDILDGKLANAVAKLEGNIGRLETKVDGLETKIENDVGRAVAEMKGELATMDAKFDAKFSAMDEKFDALRDRFDTQGRYVFMVLALIAALGLYNAVSPHIPAKTPAAAAANPAVAQTRDT